MRIPHNVGVSTVIHKVLFEYIALSPTSIIGFIEPPLSTELRINFIADGVVSLFAIVNAGVEVVVVIVSFTARLAKVFVFVQVFAVTNCP